MISGAHTIIYSSDAEKTRAFFRDVLGLHSVDAGRGWLIFALPPGEVAAHPAEHGAASGSHELFLMCDDVKSTVKAMAAKGVKFTAPVSDQPWGLLTTFELPGAGQMSLYQPRHPVPR